uniref:non-specific serine/threonine protein kinase n=1 Tax=Arcella intermedia TaxID=1963864 RepID=A0A6B2L6H9_9EUKA
MDIRVGSKYKLIKKIGSGSFGSIYLAVHVDTKMNYAVKLEPVKSLRCLLKYEADLYRFFSGGVGIPHVKWFGVEGDYNVMIMELLGPSLEDLFNYCGRKFTLKTILMLADQMLRRIEYIHCRNYLHRDIKPDNFLFGINEKSNILHVIDYGLSKKFKANSQHVGFAINKQLTGTARYASLNTHFGLEQSRRDDLESIGYVLVYFASGALPWQGLKAYTKSEKYNKILNSKMTTSTTRLTQGLPEEFRLYIEYCRSLGFTDQPDYKYLRGLFKKCMIRMGYKYDFEWDWVQNDTVNAVTSNLQSITISQEKTQQTPSKASEASVSNISFQNSTLLTRVSGSVPFASRMTGSNVSINGDSTEPSFIKQNSSEFQVSSSFENENEKNKEDST